MFSGSVLLLLSSSALFVEPSLFEASSFEELCLSGLASVFGVDDDTASPDL